MCTARLFIYLLLASAVFGGAAYYLRTQKARKAAAAAKQARQQAIKAAPTPKQDGYDESWIVRLCSALVVCGVRALAALPLLLPLPNPTSTPTSTPTHTHSHTLTHVCIRFAPQPDSSLKQRVQPPRKAKAQ